MAASGFRVSSILTLACLVLLLGNVSAQLSTSFYSSTCPTLLPIVRSSVQSAVSVETRMAASILRLFFHDCFVNGCDGSILLDDTDSFTGEKNAGPNRNSARGFEVIDDIKAAVENACPGIVSCADILAIAARESVVLLEGPSWNVRLGRRDATTASQSQANSDIPGPSSTLDELSSRFRALGLTPTDLVALSGAHTIGLARCATFRDRIYSDNTIDADFASSRQANCPETPGSGDDNLTPLDPLTPNTFDNHYFRNLVEKRGLLQSDQVLFSGGSTDPLVQRYSDNNGAFFSDFAAAMERMGNINPLTGSNGEIRVNCRVVN